MNWNHCRALDKIHKCINRMENTITFPAQIAGIEIKKLLITYSLLFDEIYITKDDINKSLIIAKMILDKKNQNNYGCSNIIKKKSS